MLGAPARIVETVATTIREWPVRAQQRARRNAMVAATACTARRAERDEVLAFLHQHEAAADASDDVAGQADVVDRRAH